MSSSYHGSRSSLNDFGPSHASQAEVQDSSRLLDSQWITVQKKTFTKWCNEKLRPRKMALTDLAADLSDGVALINLLEVIGDESLGRYNKTPKLRIQKVENMNTALAFIKRRGVHLTNIGSEDLVDQNEKLALGLIWMLILRFSIADISEEGLTAKEGLLLWCQRKTAPYMPLVHVKDFTFSWQDGLAFCALIHRHRPDLLNFDSLDKADRRGNMALAFDVAATHLGIPKLLDVEDVVDIIKPDERSLMTYIALYFHAFSAMDRFEVSGRRVNKFVSVVQSAWEMQTDYEKRARSLLDATNDKRAQWKGTTLADTYVEAKAQSLAFSTYKTTTKRTWMQEKVDLNSLLGNLSTKLTTYKMASYTPPAGLTLADLDAAFAQLTKDEAAYKTAVNSKIRDIKDNLQVSFANIANALHDELNQISTILADTSGELDEQSARVVQLQSRVRGLKTRIPELNAINEDCVAAGVEENEHTILSVDDIQFDLSVVESALAKKLAFVENQKVARQMDGITPQQLEEWESIFRVFDKDLSNSLNSIEFKAALAGLGISLSDEEFKNVFDRVSVGTNEVVFQQFVEYMRSITEDRTSPDQLAEAFKQLAAGKAFVSVADMQIAHLTQESIEFLTQVMPASAAGEGFDYEVYLAKCFGGNK
ncbi:calponin homology domain-containing protein [Catenaria anguillulae PL171]|uniref:Calponin homology domain-containing protein n=1 Tax=Catenaria anguillulae PL171 TaxID=765915 RepID=A0A1Y2HWR1_9FUNG|nr:calponin homology domain-containing protein [Catenaria anguillulae PL171]